MNTSTVVSFPVAADLSGQEHVAVKLTSTGINIATSITDRVIGTLLRGNNSPQAGQSAVGMSADVFLAIGNGIHWVKVGNSTAIALGDELELGTTDGTYVKRVAGAVAGIAAGACPASSAGGRIRAILLPQSSTAGQTSVAVTQITSRSTGVTANALSGVITTTADSIAAGVEVTFTVTNSRVAIGDVPVIAAQSGGASLPVVSGVAAGSFNITLTNVGAGADTTAMLINFVIVKAAV